LLYQTHSTPSQLRHSLAVLVQEHFIFWYTSPENDLTFYEADHSRCYNLVRSGKYVRIAEERFGTLAGEIVGYIIQIGHGRVGDLVQACTEMETQAPNGAPNGHPDMHEPPMCNGSRLKSSNSQATHISSPAERIHSILSDLLRSGLVSTTNEFYFYSDADKRFEAEQRATQRSKIDGKMTKDEAKDFERAIAAQLEAWKHGVDGATGEAKNINGKRKRSLDNGDTDRDGKRLRLTGEIRVSSAGSLNVSSVAGLLTRPHLQADSIQEDLVLRVNHEKFTVLERNSRFVELARSSICSTSSHIYSKMLQMLEKDTRQCKQEPPLPGTVIDVDEELNPYSLPKLRTDDLQAILTEVPEMAEAIGHTDRSKINMARFDHPKKRRRKDPSIPNGDVEMAEVDGQASSDESEDGEDQKGNVSGVDTDPDNPNEWDEDLDFHPLYPIPRKRKRSASPSPKGPPSPLRQHLFLLSNQPFGFLHHLPASRSTRESWSVDFHGLARHLLTNSIFHIITNRFGTLATRLIRILQEKGKLDEKTLTSSGLLNQKTMRALLTAMNRAGFLELQEVPKGNDRQPSKTIYLWFFDEERCRLRILDETYKTMTRVLQRIGVERERVKGTVEKSERVDVQGREEEILGGEEKKALKDWRAKEERLLGELGKLDDLVAVLRDF